MSRITYTLFHADVKHFICLYVILGIDVVVEQKPSLLEGDKRYRAANIETALYTLRHTNRE